MLTPQLLLAEAKSARCTRKVNPQETAESLPLTLNLGGFADPQRLHAEAQSGASVIVRPTTTAWNPTGFQEGSARLARGTHREIENIRQIPIACFRLVPSNTAKGKLCPAIRGATYQAERSRQDGGRRAWIERPWLGSGKCVGGESMGIEQRPPVSQSPGGVVTHKFANLAQSVNSLPLRASPNY